MTRRAAFLAAAIVVLAGCGGAGVGSPSIATPPSAAGTPTQLPPTPSPSASPVSPSIAPSASAAAVLTWAPIAPSDPTPDAREDHTWTFDPAGRAAWLFGGRDGGREFADLWRYDLASDIWARQAPIGPGPDARFGHTATWVEGVGLVVWSGQSTSTFFDDLWAYDPASNRWRELPTDGPIPEARYGSCAALGPDGRLWISHGFTEDSGRFDDTQAYDFDVGRWTDETPLDGTIAPIRCLHDCLWTADGRLVLYAGQTTGTPAIGDLWTRGVDAGWTSVADGPPPARQLYALATIDGTAYVFGGGAKDGGTLRDLWLLDLSTLAWKQASTRGDRPSGRSGSAFVADPVGSRLLLFGGKREGRALGDVWGLSIGR